MLLTDEAPLRARAAALLATCRARSLTIATAESCTGGLIAALLTAIAGCSDVVLGGAVTYSNDLKRDWLGVPETMLAEHGAVSGQVARAMADGIRQRTACSLAVAVTGIAGPGGGSAGKPVGTVWLAVAGGSEPAVAVHAVFPGDRDTIRRATVSAALRLLQDRAEDG